MATETQAARQKLVEDFKALSTDTEELLRATAGQAGERVTAARLRVEERLHDAKEAVAAFGDTVADRTRAAARATDEAVRQHPWESVAIAAGVGFLLGMLTSRR
jgi:ElaB/YqjD/DUF883 family membrane-anchored ribosome-binding protein